MIARLLSKVMDWALARNGDGAYDGEDSTKWAYTIRGVDGTKYLSRILLPRVRIPFLGEWRPMIHHFHRPDDDRELHNHPWKRAFSLVLSGAYEEERLAGDPRPHRYFSPEGQCGMCGLWRGECTGHEPDKDLKLVRFFNTLTGDDYHRVTELKGDVWTLFVAGERKEDDSWGFLSYRGEHVPWKEFLDARKREHELLAGPQVAQPGADEQVAQSPTMLDMWGPTIEQAAGEDLDVLLFHMLNMKRDSGEPDEELRTRAVSRLKNGRQGDN